MACSKEALRIILWMAWVSQWLLSTIYVALTLASFSFLWEASTVYLVQQGTNIYSDKTWRAPMATCLLSSLLVIGFDLFSCITLIKKSVNRAGPGFGYGFIVAFCFTLSFFLLLSALVLDSFRPKVNSLATYDWTLNNTRTPDFTWDPYNSHTFIGAEVFALINFCTFLIFAVVLVVLQNGVSEQLGIDTTHYTVLDSAAPAGVPPLYDQAGFATGYEEQQYGYSEEDQNLRGAGDPYAQSNQYQAPLDPGNQSSDYYNPQAGFNQQGYNNQGYNQGFGGAQPTYNQAYDYQEPQGNQQAVGGSSLLGGQVIGTNPAQPPPPYAAYQQTSF